MSNFISGASTCGKSKIFSFRGIKGFSYHPYLKKKINTNYHNFDVIFFLVIQFKKKLHFRDKYYFYLLVTCYTLYA